jgi:predicted nucleic acid-binding protein
MTVVDASVVVAYLVGSDHSSVVAERLQAGPSALCAPHLIDAEVGHALRGVVAGGALSPGAGRRALGEFSELPLHRQGHEVLLEVAWGLRSNLSFYDALYVALAAISEQPLVTLDARLAAAPGLPAEVELLTAA